MKLQLVIGAGEVGRAIAALLRPVADVALLDTEQHAVSPGSTMHLAYPWGPEFISCAREYQELHQPAYTVIHSTVPVGTARQLGAISSPVRGRHPQLLESLRTFPKFYGGDDAIRASEAFTKAGTPARYLPRPEEAEAGKLWELEQFLAQVQQQKHIWQWCHERGLDPDVVYTQFASTYNAGYRAVGESHFARPILRDMPGPVGGHCVLPGTALLGDPMADALITWHDQYVAALAKA